MTKESVIRFLNSRAFSVASITVYAVIVLASLPYHEPWRDEAQAWLLGRDLGLADLIHELGYDGSPPLWHLILKLLSSVGLPYFSMSLAHAVIAIGAVAIFMLYAPFPPLFRLLFVFSYYMLYEYALIARSYALSVLFLFALASLFRKRYDKPLLFGLLAALLVNTNTHSMFPAAAFGLLFVAGFFRKKDRPPVTGKMIVSIALMMLGALLAIYTLLPPADAWKPGLFNQFAYLAPVDAIANAFLPACLTNPGMTLFYQHWSAWVFFSTFLLAALFYLAGNRNALFFFLFSFLGLVYILVFKHSGYLRHYGFILLFLLTALWIVESGKERENDWRGILFPTLTGMRFYLFAFLSMSLSTSVITGIQYLRLDIRKPFSGAKEMAEYILDNDLGDHIAAGYNIHYITALYPYLPGQAYWDPGLERAFTYIHWDSTYLPSRHLEESVFMDRALKQAAPKERYYILLTRELQRPDQYGLVREKFVNSDQITGDEKYYLYRHQP